MGSVVESKAVVVSGEGLAMGAAIKSDSDTVVGDPPLCGITEHAMFSELLTNVPPPNVVHVIIVVPSGVASAKIAKLITIKVKRKMNPELFRSVFNEDC